jgi:hypothetical protein
MLRIPGAIKKKKKIANAEMLFCAFGKNFIYGEGTLGKLHFTILDYYPICIVPTNISS